MADKNGPTADSANKHTLINQLTTYNTQPPVTNQPIQSTDQPTYQAEAELLAAITLFFERVGLTSKDVGIKVSNRKVGLLVGQLVGLVPGIIMRCPGCQLHTPVVSWLRCCWLALGADSVR